jgi:membrane-associated phospholipid phosphatase
MRSAPRFAAGLVRDHRDGLREVVLVSLFVLAYFGIRNQTAGSAATAYANADRLMRFERTVHLAWEASLQAPVVAHPLLVTLANWVYIWGHWPVIIVVAFLLFRYRRGQYLLLRNALFVSGAIGFLFFALFPVAPPRLADPALVDTVTLHSHAYRALQPPGLTDQFAAFPSLHFGWNLLAGIAVFSAVRYVPLRVLCIVGPAAMAAAVVITANHYVVDVLGGLAVVLVGLAVSLATSSPRLHSAADAVLHRSPRGQRPGAASPGGRARH